MPYLVGVLVGAAGIIFWMIRARNSAHIARDVAGEAADIAQTVMNAPRRFGFMRRARQHPVESLDDGRAMLAGMALAFMDMGGTVTREDRDALLRSLQSRLGLGLTEAEELITLGHWLVVQCGRPDAAFSRMARRLGHLDPAMLKTFVAVLKDVTPERGLTDGQRDEFADFARRFRLS